MAGVNRACGSAALGGTLALTVGGIAYGQLAEPGPSLRDGSAGAGNPFFVSQTGIAGDPLTPGGPAQTLEFTVTNRGPDPRHLDRITVTVADEAGRPWSAVVGCSAADFRLDPPSIEYGLMDGRGTTRSGTVRFRMMDSDRRQDACKGQAVPLFFSAG